MNVGIRELKAHLSAYLDAVDAGTTIVVTDRGRPRARIVPVTEPDVVERGLAEGWIATGPAFGRAREVAPPVAFRSQGGVSAADLLDQDRGA